MAPNLHVLFATAMFLVISNAAILQPPPDSTRTGAILDIPLGQGAVPHPVWSIGDKCWHWNADKAPKTMRRKLDASFCRSVRVPSKAVYHLTADISTAAATAGALGVVRIFQETHLLLWRPYYQNHNDYSSPHESIHTMLVPNVDYMVCFTGKQQSFDLCDLNLYSCQSQGHCDVELAHQGTLALSQRS